MPGTRRYASGGAYVKEHGGKTVTLYPKADLLKHQHYSILLMMALEDMIK